MKKTIVTLGLVSLIGLGTMTATKVFAQSSTNNPNPMESLVQKIAQKFGLNQAEVQAVFDADQQERQKARETRYETTLIQAVSEGKLTESQKALILQKHQEMQSARQTQMENMKSMTPEERKAAMDQERTDLETWAQQNGINTQYLMGGYGGPGNHHGFGGSNKAPLSGQN